MTTLHVPDQLAHCYEEVARENGRDTQDFMLEALSNYLEDMRVVTERLNDPQPSLSLEEVKRDLGLDS
jgi:hypothetical protein